MKNLLKALASRGGILSWILPVLFFLLTIWGWLFVRYDIEANAGERFDLRVNEIKFNIKERMLAYKQVLLGVKGFLSASDSVDRSEWGEYVKTLKIDQIYPGILGIGYAVVLSPGERKSFTARIRNEGFPGYHIWPETNNEIITSIIFLEPFSGRNLRAFGYDMFTEPVRRAAMTNALDNMIASMSGKVILVQETEMDIQSGFLMYIPYYKKGMPLNSVEERRKAIAGFVYSPFRMNDLMNGIIGVGLPDIHLSIFDEPGINDSALMFASDPPDWNLDESAVFSVIENILVDGRTWHLKFSSLPSFESTIDYEKAEILLYTGIIISFLIFVAAQSMWATWKFNRQLEQILETSGEGIFGLDTSGRCTFINSSALSMLGYRMEEIIDRNVHKLIHSPRKTGEKKSQDVCAILSSMKDGREKRVEDDCFWRKDGTLFHVDYFANPIVERNEIRGTVVTFNDISERLKSQEEIKELAKRLNDTVESITDAFFTLDHEWRFTYVNKETEKLLLKNREELLNKNIWEKFPDTINTKFYNEFHLAFNEDIAIEFEEYYEGMGKWFEVHVYPSNYGLTVFLRDISGRKDAEEKIEASLKEKDVLLKEIHHRVKNNLQIIASLLSLQSQHVNDEHILALLNESQNRIRSMALIHEKLYQAKNMLKIDLSDYMKDLVEHLIRSYNSQYHSINLKIDINNVHLDVDKTISLGLAVNELVSNSLKHGFKIAKTNDAEIILSMHHSTDGIIEMIIQDNGVGFPDKIDFKNTSSLGLQLVNALVEQIEGTIKLEGTAGTKFIITFRA